MEMQRCAANPLPLFFVNTWYSEYKILLFRKNYTLSRKNFSLWSFFCWACSFFFLLGSMNQVLFSSHFRCFQFKRQSFHFFNLCYEKKIYSNRIVIFVNKDGSAVCVASPSRHLRIPAMSQSIGCNSSDRNRRIFVISNDRLGLKFTVSLRFVKINFRQSNLAKLHKLPFKESAQRFIVKFQNCVWKCQANDEKQQCKWPNFRKRKFIIPNPCIKQIHEWIMDGIERIGNFTKQANHCPHVLALAFFPGNAYKNYERKCSKHAKGIVYAV